MRLPTTRKSGHRSGLRRLAVRTVGIVALGTAGFVTSPLATGIASAAADTVTFTPTASPTVTVPDDGAMQGGLTALVENAGTPQSGVTVTGAETGDGGSGFTPSCVTNSSGECLLLTNHSGSVATGTFTASIPGPVSTTATVDFVAMGTAPSGMSALVVTNGDAAAPLAGTDLFSNGNHYFIEESSGNAADYDATHSEAVVTAPMNGATGAEPYALTWSIQNTGAASVYFDAIASVAALPNENVICTSTTPTSPPGSSACTTGSFDLDTNSHFSNPATPALGGVGANNGTMAAGSAVIDSGATLSFTSYMTGALNDARIVLDSPTGLATSATVSVQLAQDPAGSVVGGSNIGGATTPITLAWRPAASGSSVSGSLVASDTAAGSNAADDWVVVNVAGTSELVNYDQTTGQTYSAVGTSQTLAQFQTDLGSGTYASYGATGYGATGQANGLGTDALALAPSTVTVPADGSIEGSITATVTDVSDNPVAGITVTVISESDSGSGHSTSCVTAASTGQCQLYTNASATVQTGVLTAQIQSSVEQTATVDFTAPGSAPTGLTTTVANGDGASASLAAGDTFSDGNHYLIEESGASPADYDATKSEAVVTAQLSAGGSPLAAGDEPYALSWTIHNTGASHLYLDAVGSVAALPTTNVICTVATQTDPAGSANCSAGSFDLDNNTHFSNPANPGFDDVGTVNNTMGIGATTIAPGGSLTFTDYMVGANNNADVVLDSPTGLAASAVVTTQLSSDPFQSLVDGSAIGSASTADLVWDPAVATASPIGSLTAHDSSMGALAVHDWLVLDASGTSELANFAQTTGQTYSAGGASVSMATFEDDITSSAFPTYSATGYGANGQANVLSTTTPPPPPPTPQHYWTVASDGGIFAFDAPFYGSIGGRPLNAPIVGMAVDPVTDGYWLVASDGGIFAFNAPYSGSMGGKHLNSPIVGMAVDPATQGYWLVAADGGIFAFNAPYSGSMGGQPLNRPIVGMTADPSTQGYWMVASDGGIFAFNAPYSGSMGGQPLNRPIVGMTADPSTQGYWMVASDGGIFAFNAPYSGSMGGQPLNRPIVGMAVDPVTNGYWLVASDGGIFAFNAPFNGSEGGSPLNAPMVGIAESST